MLRIRKREQVKAVVKITRAIKKVHYRNEVPKFRGIKSIQTGNHEHLNTAKKHPPSKATRVI
jgi:ERCC4-type nuclease